MVAVACPWVVPREQKRAEWVVEVEQAEVPVVDSVEESRLRPPGPKQVAVVLAIQVAQKRLALVWVLQATATGSVEAELDDWEG
jgi:hypothetical protein